MLTSISFFTLILTCFSQTQPDEPFECCNTCEDPAQCQGKFYWPQNRCDQYRPPFWPDNFCPGEDPQRDFCSCTNGLDRYVDANGNEYAIDGQICVRSLPDPDDPFGYGQWLCDNSDRCSATNLCPDNYYCVDTCCDDGDRRCVPCCNEPEVNPPTPDPTPRPSSDPTGSPIPEPTRDPTLSPIPDPTPDPTPRPTPIPVDVGECPCEEPVTCESPFTWPSDCMPPNEPFNYETVFCPVYGEQFELQTRCSCTYHIPFDSTTGKPENVCIKEPIDDNYDQLMCRCAQKCDPDNPCPPNHYCVYTCCDQIGEEPYRCVPCCDTPWIIEG